MRAIMPRKPKQRLNLLKLAAQKLDAKLETSDGRRLSKREIGVIKLVNRFVETGDPKIFMTLVEIVHHGGRPEISYRAPPGRRDRVDRQRSLRGLQRVLGSKLPSGLGELRWEISRQIPHQT